MWLGFEARRRRKFTHVYESCVKVYEESKETRRVAWTRHCTVVSCRSCDRRTSIEGPHAHRPSGYCLQPGRQVLHVEGPIVEELVQGVVDRF